MLFIRGGGYGHGVGLSQYGAYGYALHGKSYKWILRHYYQGTRLGATNPNRPVTVLLSTGQAAFAGATAAGKTHLKPGMTYVVGVLPSGALKLTTSSGKKVKGTFASPLTVTGPGPLQLAGKGTYHGSLQFTPDGSGGVQTVNVVALDDYVRGVVTSEMPSTWSAQALEAQAVAARTFALTGGVAGNGFELYDDTRSQVYGGVGAETASGAAAVAATRGQIVTYDGAPAITYFSSSSGGHTEDVQNVFPGTAAEPWLRGVPDRYDGAGHNPYHRWGSQMTLDAAASALGSLVKGKLVGIRVTEHGASPRILEAAVVGTRGTSTVSGETLQRIFGLRTTYASFETISTSSSAGELGGTIYPAPAHGTLAVESWLRGAWHKVTTAPVSAAGYSVVVPGSGRFRVTYRGLDGPGVSVHQPEASHVDASLDAAAASALRGLLPSWVNVYAGSHAWPTARDRRAVRPVPLVLRAP
jgi:stage II sporulation protein D